ncbi:uncharacterized protein LOC129717612 [Wyeomyia smithii]|uniref:uncharacterized protein LOC129717612 n=1 Tax=Wyeomyia smithii TaxID=174621 RepID=UPI002467AC79|nr:uncharacterized protein LOC129717612 [Wyeomyia smithii]
MSTKLLASMERRIHKLKASMAFKACLYIDPRFNFAGSGRLSQSDKKEAQEYLIALNDRLDNLEGSREAPKTNVETIANRGFVEDYLMDFFNEGSQDTVSSTSMSNSSTEPLLFNLLKLENREKVNITVGDPLPSSSSSNNSDQNNTCITNKSQHGTSAVQPAISISTSSRFDIIQYWKKGNIQTPAYIVWQW